MNLVVFFRVKKKTEQIEKKEKEKESKGLAQHDPHVASL
jgi:hypothetical protein